MTDRILMCAPDNFDVAYVINPWMEGNVAHCNSKLAMQQWQALVQAIRQVARVERITGGADVPDMVFTANAGLVLDNKVVLSRFRHSERQPEEALFATWFEEHKFEVLRLPSHLPFEGAGDALIDSRQPLLWLGYGHRTDPACAPLLADWLQLEVEPLRLVNNRFYHLDTCFCPLQGGHLMYYPDAFDPLAQARILARVPEKYRIAVSAADAASFACNAVSIGSHVLLNDASAELVQTLNARGYRVHRVPLSEFMKAGGGAKCLTLKLNESLMSRAVRRVA